MSDRLVHPFATLGVSWNSKDNLHSCAPHVINLIAKDFLSGMKELSPQDLAAFEVRAARIETEGIELHDDGIDQGPEEPFEFPPELPSFAGLLDLNMNKLGSSASTSALASEDQARVRNLGFSNSMGVVAAVRAVVTNIRKSVQS